MRVRTTPFALTHRVPLQSSLRLKGQTAAVVLYPPMNPSYDQKLSMLVCLSNFPKVNCLGTMKGYKAYVELGYDHSTMYYSSQTSQTKMAELWHTDVSFESLTPLNCQC